MAQKIETLIIFGADGDLAHRLLLPGLAQLIDSPSPQGAGPREATAGLSLVGVGQSDFTPQQWQQRLRDAFTSAGVVGPAALALAEASHYLRADATEPADLRRVLAAAPGVPALYFAVPPAVAVASVTALHEVELPEGTVLALEKPFGTDLASARRLNGLLAGLVPEQQVHRVDHFLGKSTVLNLMGLRFANRLFENAWNRDNVASVEIIFDEALALEGRAGYYDRAGALDDMIQSHLLQVLALVAMEPPASLDADDLRGAMAQALRATRMLDADPALCSRRARYTAGSIGSRRVPSYVDEPGVEASRGTETLAELSLTVDTWRWAGVPFVLRSGKALGDGRRQTTVTFREVPHLPTGLTGQPQPSSLRVLLSPERVELDVVMNGAGDPFALDQATLAADFGAGALLPYGEVLLGILTSDPTLSLRADVVEECWRIVEPVVVAWRADAVPLDEYAAGSAGPDSWSAAGGS